MQPLTSRNGADASRMDDSNLAEVLGLDPADVGSPGDGEDSAKPKKPKKNALASALGFLKSMNEIVSFCSRRLPDLITSDTQPALGNPSINSDHRAAASASTGKRSVSWRATECLVNPASCLRGSRVTSFPRTSACAPSCRFVHVLAPHRLLPVLECCNDESFPDLPTASAGCGNINTTLIYSDEFLLLSDLVRHPARKSHSCPRRRN